MSVLDLPPFPRLGWDDGFWVGEITLPSWVDFQTRRGGYNSVSSAHPSDGSVQLVVVPSDEKSQTPPTVEQVAAFRHLLDHEASVAASVLRALFDRYPEEKKAYDEDYDEEDDVQALPVIQNPGELHTLIGLSIVHVLSVVKDGVAYVGFEFGCVWDREHGAGVMTHLGRVTALGQADTAFVAWIARRDAEPNS